MRILIRADASPSMGTGHVMRCLALALAARASGLGVRMIGRVQVSWVRERLQKEGIAFTALEGDVPERELPEDLLLQVQDPQKPDWIVLDGYHFGPDCQKAVRQAGYRLLVIDDYNHLPEYHADILLNQNIGAEYNKYIGNIGHELLGMRYALLRQEFLTISPDSAVDGREYRNFLVTLGGGDQVGILKLIAPGLHDVMNEHAKLEILLGGTAKTDAEQAVDGLKCAISFIEPSADVASHFKKADFIVTAAGSTCYEICVLAKPFGFVILAENQRSARIFFEQEGIAPCLADLSGGAAFNLADFKQKLYNAIFWPAFPPFTLEHNKYVWLNLLRRNC